MSRFDFSSKFRREINFLTSFLSRQKKVRACAFFLQGKPSRNFYEIQSNFYKSVKYLQIDFFFKYKTENNKKINNELV